MKANYRITFYDGPEGNRSKNVDVFAESFDEARAIAYKMPEARNRMYSDMLIEKIPEGPSIIGIEFEFEMKSPPFYEKGKDYLFIKANSEAEALQYYNSHFKGERYNRRAGETVPDGCRVRKRATKTYFAGGCVYCADATIEGKEASLDEKIKEAADSTGGKSVASEKIREGSLER